MKRLFDLGERLARVPISLLVNGELFPFTFETSILCVGQAKIFIGSSQETGFLIGAPSVHRSSSEIEFAGSE